MQEEEVEELGVVDHHHLGQEQQLEVEEQVKILLLMEIMQQPILEEVEVEAEHQEAEQQVDQAVQVSLS
jgi:hypothetical protein